MSLERYKRYFNGQDKVPAIHMAWPLYGAGLESLGKDGKSVERIVPTYADDELLIRHDAVGLCFTDAKEIKFGDQHPRLIGRGLATNPIVPGHETSITVVGVGKKLKGEYDIGDRFVIQPDVWYQGKSIPYSFGMDGAYRQYAVMGKEILCGDEGNYLISIPENMSYAGAALTEPWACVEAAYSMVYRNSLQPDGSVWMMGSKNCRSGYRLDKIWDSQNAPSRIVLTNIPSDLEKLLSALGKKSGITVQHKERDEVIKAGLRFNDIILLDCEAEDVDVAGSLLEKNGVLAIMRHDSMGQTVSMDFGRIHYDNIVYIGTTGTDIDEAYTKTPVRSELKKGGVALILGAGGPMGRMHVQRAIESYGSPKTVVATDVDRNRLGDLKNSFSALVSNRNIEFRTANPVEDKENYDATMNQIARSGGFDDIEVMVTNLSVIGEVSEYVAENGIINLFAGLKRGTMASVDPWLIYGPKQIRYIGHSGSKLQDQVAIVNRFKNGELEPQRSMAALCGLNQIAEGVQAMIDSVYPGKIVVYPMVRDFPLTGLGELKSVLPEVYGRLENGRFWTLEAEKVFLESVLQ
jgi:threonine dehydrogenase-like Zn-dependent dehydrogenase